MSAPMSRKWKVVLIVSAALNLFLIAVIATAVIKGPPPRDRGLATAPFSMPWASHVLGKDTRSMAREIFRSHFPEFTGVREALLADSRNLAKILGEPQFDRAKFESALSHLQDNTDAALRANHTAMVDFAEKITPEQRAELAHAIEEFVDHRERRFRHWQERREKRRREDAD